MISISIANDPDHLAWIIFFAETAEKKEGGVNVRLPIHPLDLTTGPNLGGPRSSQSHNDGSSILPAGKIETALG